MDKLIINGCEYRYTILPNTDNKVCAEIFKVITYPKSNMSDSHILILSKSFGSIFRTPKEKDYTDARDWVESQMLYMQKANQ